MASAFCDLLCMFLFFSVICQVLYVGIYNFSFKYDPDVMGTQISAGFDMITVLFKGIYLQKWYKLIHLSISLRSRQVPGGLWLKH